MQLTFKSITGLHNKAKLVIGLERETPVVLMGEPKNVALLIPEWTKENQKKVDAFQGQSGGTYHWDNALLEVTNNPEDSFSKCVHSLNRMQRLALQEISSINGNRQHAYFVENLTCAIEYSAEELDTPEAWKAGCDPSLNAYNKPTGRGIRYKDNWRFGGTHFNIDCTGSKEQFAMALDNTLGLISVLATQCPEDERRRRELYGRAGEYRSKPFGIEYRVLSNTFPELIPLYGENLTDFIKFLGCNVKAKRKHDLFKEIMRAKPKQVEEAINNVDKDLAATIMKPYIQEII